MELAHIEKQIYDLESTYLEDTQSFGNIFQGWNQYFVKETKKNKKKICINNKDRLFSLSSASSPAALIEGRRVGVALSDTIDNIKRSQSEENSSNKRSRLA